MKKVKGLLLAALLLTAGPVRAQFFPGTTADEPSRLYTGHQPKGDKRFGDAGVQQRRARL